ncbi:hypothetical protein [Devosia aquimaris]|uniref:hypothetical protein n=1 Tax=Devosia aquimaris TaxID=2866214 RepID=UPI001CD0B54B|nr:hypothetical protein [Devosia sp. CJK-A8-3]
MRRIALTAALIALTASPALAQSFEGNWGCRDADGTKAGMLTIYGGVYGFASTIVGDTSSGTGTITGYQDGVGFNDGALKASRGIEAGRIVAHPNAGVAIQLETKTAAVMLCTPR